MYIFSIQKINAVAALNTNFYNKIKYCPNCGTAVNGNVDPSVLTNVGNSPTEIYLTKNDFGGYVANGDTRFNKTYNAAFFCAVLLLFD